MTSAAVSFEVAEFGTGIGTLREIGSRYGTDSSRVQLPDRTSIYVDLNGYLSISYWLILPEMLRRERPQSSAHRPTLPRLFSRALMMYCRSICSVASLR